MSIPVERYSDPASLDEELEKIFWRRCFVAHESDVAATDSYFGFRLGRHNFTLRRFDSDLTLLNNVCRHRFNLIDPPGFGIRNFRCGYHGWTYGRSGEAVFIPLQEDFERKPPPLATFGHRNVNGYIFKSEPSARHDDQFGELIEEIGGPGGEMFYRGELRHRCNWKLMVENVLEGYHLSVVHPNTFGKSGLTSTSRADSTSRGTDSVLTTYPHSRFSEHMRTIFPGVVPGYRHLFAFPNLFVSVTNDLIYFVSNLLPISAQETILYYRLLPTTRFAELSAVVQQHLRQEAVRFTEEALNEDKAILESCQLGIENAEGAYLLGSRERRIEHFHASYKDWL